MSDSPALPDDEGRSGGAPVFAAVHVLFLPHAVAVAYRMIGIGQQREIELELVGKILHVFDRVGADAQHCDAGLFVIGPRIAEAAGFFGAAGRIGFGIKIEDDRLLGRQFLKLDCLAVTCGKSEIGSLLADFWNLVFVWHLRLLTAASSSAVR